MRTSNRNTKTIGGALVAAGLVASVLSPATADAKPRGFVQEEFSVGLVYGTFNDGPNLTLLVGGAVEEFCPGDPGTAPMRVFVRADGTEVRKVNDRHQPIFLYEQSVGDSFDWIDDVCENLDDDTETVEPYATGTAHLIVRESETPDGVVDIFNSVNGRLVASDDTNYRVRASADFILGLQGPVGDPADFVSLRLKKIGR